MNNNAFKGKEDIFCILNLVKKDFTTTVIS